MERHAIFPLNLFLLPGEITHLHIFEPRYKQLVKDVEEEKIPFGIYCRSTDNRRNLGTMVELVEVLNRYNSGELDISVRATRLFKLEWFFEKLNNKLYPGGEIEWYELEGRNISKQVSNEFRGLVELTSPDQIVSLPEYTHELLASLHLKSTEKLQIIQMQSQVNQDKILLNHIRLQTAIAKQEKAIQYNFNLN